MPFEIMAERVLPIWIILVPVSARRCPLVSATEYELADRIITAQDKQPGYFRVIAEPVSDWVHDILLFSSHSLLITVQKCRPCCCRPGTSFIRWNTYLQHLYG